MVQNSVEHLMEQESPFTCGVILSGGRSSRFGRNKALAMLKGRPVIEHVADIMSRVFGRALMLVTNTPDEYEFLSMPMVADLIPGHGPLSGLHAAMESLAQGNVRFDSGMVPDRVFMVACDMPVLNPRLIKWMVRLSEPASLVIPEVGGRLQPLHAIYHLSLRQIIREMMEQGSYRIGTLVDRVPGRIIGEQEVMAVLAGEKRGGVVGALHEPSRPDPFLLPFYNVNTVDDLEILDTLIKEDRAAVSKSHG